MRHALTVALLLSLLVLSACQDDTAKLAEHISRGEAYVEEGKLDEAIIEFKSALQVDPNHPLPFAQPGQALYKEEQQAEFQLINKLNQLAAVEYPDDPATRARIKSYELAFRMQMAVPESMEFKAETNETHQLYGLSKPVTKTFGQQCLAARRLVERGRI